MRRARELLMTSTGGWNEMEVTVKMTVAPTSEARTDRSRDRWRGCSSRSQGRTRWWSRWRGVEQNRGWGTGASGSHKEHIRTQSWTLRHKREARQLNWLTCWSWRNGGADGQAGKNTAAEEIPAPVREEDGLLAICNGIYRGHRCWWRRPAMQMAMTRTHSNTGQWRIMMDLKQIVTEKGWRWCCSSRRKEERRWGWWWSKA